MEPRPERRLGDYEPSGIRRLLGAAGRLVGFCAAAGLAMAIFGCVLLLPECARLAKARYHLARQQAINAELAELVRANERLIANLPDDPVLTKRLAMNQLGLWPEDEVVVPAVQRMQRPPPAVVLIRRRVRPQPPSGWLLDAARRVSKPGTKRGLLLLAALALFAAIWVFPARDPGRRKKVHPPAP